MEKCYSVAILSTVGGINMIKCHLSRLMGEKRVKIAELARETGLNRNTITLLYHDSAKRIDLDALEKICRYLQCDISDVLEITD